MLSRRTDIISAVTYVPRGTDTHTSAFCAILGISNQIKLPFLSIIIRAAHLFLFSLLYFLLALSFSVSIKFFNCCCYKNWGLSFSAVWNNIIMIFEFTVLGCVESFCMNHVLIAYTSNPSCISAHMEIFSEIIWEKQKAVHNSISHRNFYWQGNW